MESSKMNKGQNIGGITGTGIGAYFQPEAIQFFTKLYMTFTPDDWTKDDLQLPIKFSAVIIAIGIAWVLSRLGHKFDKKNG